MSDNELNERCRNALLDFSLGPGVVERSAALKVLQTEKAVHKVFRTPEFQAGVNALVVTAARADEPEERLVSLTQLARIASHKGLTEEIARLSQPAFEREWPPASLLSNGDERGYVAKALAWGRAAWVQGYALRSLAAEMPNADKIRGELMAVVFAGSTNLEQVISGLREAFLAELPATDSPADSLARRLAKTVQSLREQIVVSRLVPGENAGKAFEEMASRPLARTGLPSDSDAAASLAQQLIGGTYDLVRRHFSMLTDSDTYSAVRYAKRIVGGMWPRQLEDDLQQVADCIVEAVLMLAKQGITAEDLREHLELTMGYRERAEARLRELAESHPGIDERIRRWLRGQAVTKLTTNTLLQESRDIRTDPLVGEVLMEVVRLEAAKDALAADVLPVLQIYDPSKVGPLEQLIGRTADVLRTVTNLTDARRLGLLGVVGGEVDYSPKYFVTTSGLTKPRMRVVRQAIVRLNEDGQPAEVVSQGLVE